IMVLIPEAKRSTLFDKLKFLLDQGRIIRSNKRGKYRLSNQIEADPEPPTIDQSPANNQSAVSELEDLIYEALKGAKEGLGPADLLARIPGAKERSLKRKLGDLVAAGRIAQAGRGKYQVPKTEVAE